MHVKSLTLTGHGLAMKVLLPSLQYALEMKRQNILLKFHINCATVEIRQSQSYHKWFGSRLYLLRRDIVALKGFNKSYNNLPQDLHLF